MGGENHDAGAQETHSLTLAAIALVFGIGAVAMAQNVPRNKLHYTFEQGTKTDNQDRQYIVDATDNGNTSYVKGANDGGIILVPGADEAGTAAKFPDYCTGTGCPKTLIETDAATSGGLDPGSAPFSFGAEMKLQPEDVSEGSNIVQKGLYNDPGGQWKLQVDSQRPSCRVSGILDGQSTASSSVQVMATANVVDGSRHEIACRKEANRLSILVDGSEGNFKDVPTGVGSVDNSAPVTIGAKTLTDDNDQFHGALDNVFFRLDWRARAGRRGRLKPHILASALS